MTASDFPATAVAEPPTDTDRPIVFFDGRCGLCNGFVDFAMARDRRGRLAFAPLQGETAAAALSEADRDLDSVVFRHGGRVTKRSAAVVDALSTIGGVWAAAARLLWLVPRPVRDLGYRVVAANRLRLFGERETCRMPTPAERGRLLP